MHWPGWVSWRVCYTKKNNRSWVGPWTLNHRSHDGRVTLCGRTVPQDAFDMDRKHHAGYDDCLMCRHAAVVAAQRTGTGE